MLVNHSLSLLSSFLLFLSPSTTVPKMELMEACRYGLVEQVHYFIKTGVNVNMADFVSCVSTCEECMMYMKVAACMYIASM